MRLFFREFERLLTNTVSDNYSKQFEKAVAIDGIQLSPRGFRARNIYALSRALSASSERKDDGTKMQDTAINMIGRTEPLADGDNWEVFDLLVRITER